MRTCVGCGRALPKAELLRLVRGPDGRLRADPAGRAQGRGAYVCNASRCAELVPGSASLARSLRGHVEIDGESLDSIREWQRSAFTR
ncbi:MAG: YlxR family protein [Thermoleophilaceae bacterium]